MAKVHGKDSYFSVDSDNLTTYLDNISFPRTRETVQTSTMGLESHTYTAGLMDGTISLSGKWDDTATTGPDAVLSGLLAGGAEVAFEYGPEGNDSGDIKMSGSCICTAYAVNSSLSDVVLFTAEFQVSGTVTVGTFGA